MNNTKIDVSKFGGATSPIIEKQVSDYAIPPNPVLNAGTGLRYNNGKLRYDLLEPFAIEQLAKVFTKGAEKYADNNWLGGMKWSSMIASLKRHLAAFEKGVDYDDETQLLHMAHVAWNAMALISYYKFHPQLDDRRKPYLNTLRIGLDIDGVIANWNQHLFDYTDHPIKDVHYWNCPVVDYLFDKVRTNEDFWLTIPPLINANDLPFEPACYITARTIPAEITQQWLNEKGFPKAPLYCVKEGESKVNVALNANINLFIDDSYNNFVQLNKAGITTLLYTQPYNKKYNVGHLRINNFDEFKQRFLQ